MSQLIVSDHLLTEYTLQIKAVHPFLSFIDFDTVLFVP